MDTDDQPRKPRTFLKRGEGVAKRVFAPARRTLQPITSSAAASEDAVDAVSNRGDQWHAPAAKKHLGSDGGSWQQPKGPSQAWPGTHASQSNVRKPGQAHDHPQWQGKASNAAWDSGHYIDSNHSSLVGNPFERCFDDGELDSETTLLNVDSHAGRKSPSLGPSKAHPPRLSSQLDEDYELEEFKALESQLKKDVGLTARQGEGALDAASSAGHRATAMGKAGLDPFPSLETDFAAFVPGSPSPLMEMDTKGSRKGPGSSGAPQSLRAAPEQPWAAKRGNTGMDWEEQSDDYGSYSNGRVPNGDGGQSDWRSGSHTATRQHGPASCGPMHNHKPDLQGTSGRSAMQYSSHQAGQYHLKQQQQKQPPRCAPSPAPNMRPSAGYHAFDDEEQWEDREQIEVMSDHDNLDEGHSDDQGTMSNCPGPHDHNGGITQPFVRSLFAQQQQQRGAQHGVVGKSSGKGAANTSNRSRGASPEPGPAELDRLSQLDEQLTKVQQEKASLMHMRTELEKAANRLESECKAWEKKQTEDSSAFEAMKRSESQKLQRERRVLEKQSKALLKLPNKKERSAIETLEAELEAERRESKAKEARHKLTVERLRRQIVELQEKNHELRDEVRWHESQNLGVASAAPTATTNIAASSAAPATGTATTNTAQGRPLKGFKASTNRAPSGGDHAPQQPELPQGGMARGSAGQAQGAAVSVGGWSGHRETTGNEEGPQSSRPGSWGGQWEEASESVQALPGWDASLDSSAAWGSRVQAGGPRKPAHGLRNGQGALPMEARGGVSTKAKVVEARGHVHQAASFSYTGVVEEEEEDEGKNISDAGSSHELSSAAVPGWHGQARAYEDLVPSRPPGTKVHTDYPHNGTGVHQHGRTGAYQSSYPEAEGNYMEAEPSRQEPQPMAKQGGPGGQVVPGPWTQRSLGQGGNSQQGGPARHPYDGLNQPHPTSSHLARGWEGAHTAEREGWVHQADSSGTGTQAGMGGVRETSAGPSWPAGPVQDGMHREGASSWGRDTAGQPMHDTVVHGRAPTTGMATAWGSSQPVDETTSVPSGMRYQDVADPERGTGEYTQAQPLPQHGRHANDPTSRSSSHFTQQESQFTRHLERAGGNQAYQGKPATEPALGWPPSREGQAQGSRPSSGQQARNRIESSQSASHDAFHSQDLREGYGRDGLPERAAPSMEAYGNTEHHTLSHSSQGGDLNEHGGRPYSSTRAEGSMTGEQHSWADWRPQAGSEQMVHGRNHAPPPPPRQPHQHISEGATYPYPYHHDSNRPSVSTALAPHHGRRLSSESSGPTQLPPRTATNSTNRPSMQLPSGRPCQSEGMQKNGHIAATTSAAASHCPHHHRQQDLEQPHAAHTHIERQPYQQQGQQQWEEAQEPHPTYRLSSDHHQYGQEHVQVQQVQAEVHVGASTGMFQDVAGADPMVREVRHPEGKLERFFASGKRSVYFSNGTHKLSTPDGSTTIYFSNSDVKRQHASGRVDYFYAEVGTWHTTHADKVEVFYFPTGQTEAHHPGGLKEIIFLDDQPRKVHPDGTEEDVTYASLSLAVRQPRPKEGFK